MRTYADRLNVQPTLQLPTLNSFPSNYTKQTITIKIKHKTLLNSVNITTTKMKHTSLKFSPANYHNNEKMKHKNICDETETPLITKLAEAGDISSNSIPNQQQPHQSHSRNEYGSQQHAGMWWKGTVTGQGFRGRRRQDGGQWEPR